jgi:endonuclease-3
MHDFRSTQFFKQIRRRLERSYGPRPWRRWGKGVDILVGTILSQNTSDTNSNAGYRILRRTFRSWNLVANAPVDQVERSIRISGLSRIKAPRIQSILRQIRAERGRIDLEFLADWTPHKALDYLLKFKGVGPKTANCVLLFAFGMPVFPVDTHIHRIARRMGLIPGRASADEAHELLLGQIAPEDRYALHVLLIAHGRKVCKAATPRCEGCSLRDRCEVGRAARINPGTAGRGSVPRR